MSGLPARRHREKRADGSSVEYSIPAGVTDEEAAAEVAAMRLAVLRGYSGRLRFHDGMKIDVRWFVRQPWIVQRLTLVALTVSRWPNAFDRVAFWLKCRALDVYWRIRSADKTSPLQTPEAGEGK